MKIRKWQQFARQVRPGNDALLRALPEFPGSIFVAGCQRSGGTMLARELTAHPQVTDFTWSKDAELDAALVLAGVYPPAAPLASGQRFCFQTTYLNERWVEYADHRAAFHLIWLVRNPYSVIYSMLHNWKRFALNEVFISCGAGLLPVPLAARYQRWGVLGVPALQRACYAYLGKLEQCRTLLTQLPEQQLTTLRYEELVTHKDAMLAALHQFCGLSQQAPANSEISTRSMGKADKLSQKERASVDAVCAERYENLLTTSIRLAP